ncbi:MAG TPA: TerC family protein [Miltoncostaeaceae bacterium]|nr:TerC family protein [Miltoncostaeaceae bacterium]
MEPPIWAWIALIAAVPVLTAVDFLVFGRGRHEVSPKVASLWTLAWVALGVGFTGILAATQGGTAAGEYIAGYLIEWSLSIDNLFVFAVIFAYFAVPKDTQPRVLMFGVLGALVFRGIFIAIGAAALGAAHWVIYIFGAFLLFTSYRLAVSTGETVDPSKNRLLRLVSRFVPSTDGYRDTRIFVRERGRWLATPIFAVLLVVASTDVVFAIDSIPAIFAITDEAFIVLAANIFAVLGLRAAYFVIVGALDRFEYLHYGLAAVLAVVGLKMLTSEFYDPPVWLTLAAVVVILGTAVLASLWATRNRQRRAEEAGAAPPARTPVP